MVVNAAYTFSALFDVSGERLEGMCKMATRGLYDRSSTIIALALVVTTAMAAERSGSPPPRLSETGLYADGSVTEVRAGVLPFLPQYTLWSDGATKRRWLYLPPGTFIDGSDPDRWIFPPGTRLWKEFSYAERRIETRFIERLADGTWQFATYGWNEGEGDAVLARPERATPLQVPEAPNGTYVLPSEDDCRACHESGDVPALGVSALQLSPDRDPQAPHGMGTYPSSAELDLFGLIERGWLRHLPPELLIRPPRIFARSPTERAALGYLHSNCGNCHNDSAQRAPVKLRLAQSVADAAGSHAQTLDSTVHQRSRYRPPRTSGKAYTIVPGDPDASVLALRLRSRNPRMQMPPLGTRVADAEGVALIERWITNDLFQSREFLP